MSSNEIKVALLNAPALALPDVTKPFHLCVDKKGIANGGPMQTLDAWKRPGTYLFKKLYPAVTGWPPCLHIIAATALLVKDSDNLSSQSDYPHIIKGVLKHPPNNRWFTNVQLDHYQTLFLNPLGIQYTHSSATNSATLLLDPDLNQPFHDSLGILSHLQGIRPDLKG